MGHFLDQGLCLSKFVPSLAPTNLHYGSTYKWLTCQEEVQLSFLTGLSFVPRRAPPARQKKIKLTDSSVTSDVELI